MRPKVLLLAKTGFIIRDLVLGKFSNEVIKNCTLYVAVPNPKDIQLGSFCENKPINLLPFLTREETKSNRKYFEAQHVMYRLKQVELNNSSLDINTRLLKANFSPKQKMLIDFLLTCGRLINNLGLMGIAEKIFLNRIEKWKVTHEWLQILTQLKPDFIISTMLTLPGGLFSPSVDLPIIISAKKLNIPCGTLVQSWDNLCSKTYVLPTWLNHYWTWSQAMTADLIRFNPRIDQKCIQNVGSPHYDYHLDSRLREPRDSFMRNLGMDPSRPYVVIGTGTKTMLPNEPIMVTELVRSLKENLPELQILLRIHPKDDQLRWTKLLGDFHEQGIFIQNPVPETRMDLGGCTPPQIYFTELINTIVHASAIINTTSSLTVDASIINRPIISICYDKVYDVKFPNGRALEYNFSEHFKPLVDTGGMWLVRSEMECISAIKAYLQSPLLHYQQRQKIAEIIGGNNYGVAGKNLANAVVEHFS